MLLTGRIWKFGDNIDTDLIIPGRYLDEYDIRSLSSHVFEDLDPAFSAWVERGDIIVAGRNFGCGSSREQAPAVLKERGVSAVVAASFARIFFRNAINIGLPAIVCPEAQSCFEKGDRIEIDIREARILRLSDGMIICFKPLPGFLIDILEKGGLVQFMKMRLGRN